MTIETNGESQQQQETPNTPPGTEPGTIPNSTDQSNQQPPPGQQPPTGEQQQQEPPAKTADELAAEAAAAEASTVVTNEAWKDAALDDDLKKFVGDKTPAQVAKELMNAQALLGKKSIGIPGKDSTPEEQRAFHKARGVPEDEAGYNLAPVLEELKAIAPEGWNPAPELEASFRKAARLSNISQGEAAEFAKHYLGDQFKAREELVKTEVAATKEASALLAKAWGPDRTVGEANFARGMKAVGLPAESVDVFLAAYGGSGQARFALVNAVAEIGRRQIEGGPIPGGGSGGDAGMTKEAARAEMERIKADPVLGAAYTDPTHVQHKQVTSEMTRLGKIERGIS